MAAAAREEKAAPAQDEKVYGKNAWQKGVQRRHLLQGNIHGAPCIQSVSSEEGRGEGVRGGILPAPTDTTQRFSLLYARLQGG